MLSSNPLDHEALSANDVLLVPGGAAHLPGQLRSRSDAGIEPFLFSAPMDTVTGYHMAQTLLELGHYATVSRVLPGGEEEYLQCIRDFHDNPRCFFAISSKKEPLKKFLEQLRQVKEELELETLKISVAVDVAHGDTVTTHEIYRFLRELEFIGNIMSGSICTPEAAMRVVQSGCNVLRIGVGPGAACTTRLKTGCGYPQLSAVYNINKHLASHLGGKRNALFLIADGGIKNSGDAIKYLAAGADGVMMGSVFSKCLESAGWTKQPAPLDLSGVIDFTGGGSRMQLVKSYRGQASAEFQKDTYGHAHNCPEGAASPPFVWDGKLTKHVVKEYEGGLGSALSYLGLTNTSQLKPHNVKWVRITTSTFMEGTPHGV